jgi:hypothetical protein
MCIACLSFAAPLPKITRTADAADLMKSRDALRHTITRSYRSAPGDARGRMPDRYNISKRDDGWLISVDGTMLLVCERKKVALRAVRDAMARDASTATVFVDGDAEHDDEDERDIRLRVAAAG